MRTFSVRVSRAGEPGIEFGQLLTLEQIHVLTYGALYSPIHPDPLGLQFHQCPQTDPAHRNGVDLPSPQGLQGLTKTMGVVEIAVADFF